MSINDRIEESAYWKDINSFIKYLEYRLETIEYELEPDSDANIDRKNQFINKIDYLKKNPKQFEKDKLPQHQNLCVIY